MSKVSVDGLPNHYRRTLSELEDEVRNEIKRNRQRSEERVKDIEESYKTALSRNQKEASETIDNVKREASEYVSNRREQYIESLDKEKAKMKARIEDSSGSDGMKKYYQRTIEDFEDQTNTRMKDRDKQQRNEIRRIEDTFKNTIEQKDRDAEKAFQQIREEANNSQIRTRQTLQGELDELRQTYNKKGEFQNGVSYDVHKKQIDDLVEANEKRHRYDLTAIKGIESEHRDNLQEVQRKSDSKIKNLTEKQKEELLDLYAEIKTLNDFKKTATKEQSEKLENLIRDYEEFNREQHRRVKSDFDSNVDKLKQQLAEKDAYNARSNRDHIKAREDYYSNIINKMNQENHTNTASIENTFRSQIDQLRDQMVRERDKADARLENALSNAHAQEAKSLENQAKAYGESLARVRANDQDQIDVLQKGIAQKRSNEDAGLISPKGEAAIRNNLLKGYEKTHLAEVEKNKLNLDQLKLKYSEAYQQALEEFGDKRTLNDQQHAIELSSQRNQALDTIRETEYRTTNRVRELDQDNEREKQNLIRQFSNMMERQKKEYENIFEFAHNDALAKLSNQRQESALNAKTQQRTSNTRQNELIREYEKKLADQKMDADFKIDDIQTRSKIELRDTERRLKQEAELQAKSYEQRIAQLEAQSQERERYMAQTYADEIDKVRRSYELLSKKKS